MSLIKSHNDLRVLKIKFEMLQSNYIDAIYAKQDAQKSVDYCARLVKIGAQDAEKKYQEAQKKYEAAEEKFKTAEHKFNLVIEEVKNTKGVELVLPDNNGVNRKTLQEYENQAIDMREQNERENGEHTNNNVRKKAAHTKMKDDDLIHMYS